MLGKQPSSIDVLLQQKSFSFIVLLTCKSYSTCSYSVIVNKAMLLLQDYVFVVSHLTPSFICSQTPIKNVTKTRLQMRVKGRITTM